MYTYFRKKLGVLRSGEPNPGMFNAHSPYHQVQTPTFSLLVILTIKEVDYSQTDVKSLEERLNSSSQLLFLFIITAQARFTKPKSNGELKIQ
jgi:hypothetical protein